MRQKLFDAINDTNNVGARLPLNIQDHGRGVVEPGGLADVFDAVDYVGDIGDADRRAVFVSDDDGLILRAVEDLIVSPNGVGLPGAVDIALGLVLIGTR